MHAQCLECAWYKFMLAVALVSTVRVMGPASFFYILNSYPKQRHLEIYFMLLTLGYVNDVALVLKLILSALHIIPFEEIWVLWGSPG